MDKIIIKPKLLKGNIVVPSSKSLGHRGIIAAALSRGISRVDNIQLSKDIEATMELMKELGAVVNIEDQNLYIDGRKMFSYEKKLDLRCRESGSTLRFLIPLALTKDGDYIFHGEGKLISRPLEPYYEIFEEKGIKYSREEDGLPLKVSGKLTSGTYRVRGDISSQFITGLLFSLPILEGNSRIQITTKLESKGYIDLTLDILKDFGIEIENNNYKEFNIRGAQKYNCRNYYVEGDYSQGAFFLVAGALGSSIVCSGLNKDSLQGDKVILDILEAMGCNVEESEEGIKVKPSKTKGIEIDASNCPDLVPILTVLASLSEGETKIVNAKRLRIKECDRLHAITKELNKLGANIIELEDSLIISGVNELKGGEVDSHNDHRIVMALAIAATRARGNVIINNPSAVEKSYPNFFKDYFKLGGECDEFNYRE
ncbi:MAG: 3-phosphoshikimate 1-carboxyvinyltransferase [Clostridium sulfidigenes]|uniref:3-phosphoshikimate 1-carboxyvinyltransferase n=1 Tax=Clostridium sulfidigenes TaxID=318464 RepID=A0A927ZQ76_9CLOT|nr:3-phosphoshikimate 1-carboxyvinyltransferase [Clostridium sulfidigenes]